LRDEIEQTRSSLSELLVEGDVPYLAIEALPDISMKEGDLREKITVEVPENSQLMHIRVRASDPETAALLANTVVEVGLERYGQLLAQPTANTRQFIEQELEVARAELGISEDELAQFQITNRIGDLDDAINNQYSLIRSLIRERDLAWAGGDMAKAQALEEAILKREAQLQSMLGLSAEYNELHDRVKRARSTYSFLLSKRAEAQIKENQILELSSIQIITPARPPRKPVALLNPTIVALGGVVSLVVSIMLAFVLDYAQGKQAYSAHEMLGALQEAATNLPMLLEFRRRLSDAWQVAKTWQGILAFIGIFLASIILPILAAEPDAPLGEIREGIVAYISGISSSNDATTTYRSIGETSFVVNDTMVKDITQTYYVTDTSQISIEARVQDADGETISDDEISCEWIFDPLLPEQVIGEKDGCQISYLAPENLDSQLVGVKVQGKDITQIAGASTNFINIVLKSDKGDSNE
jgi:hypothetical protein